MERPHLAAALASLEAQASTPQGASQMLNSPAALGQVLGVLKRPASGTYYWEWASSRELQAGVRIGAQLLQVGRQTEDAAPIWRAIIAAAQATLPIQPETSAMIALELTRTEQCVAGRCPCPPAVFSAGRKLRICIEYCRRMHFQH